ncbi:hypothetical protein [Elizabethkingia anophelis]|nr:MAG: hypothetical protein PQ275_19850 [Elizabethkingia anophelis]
MSNKNLNKEKALRIVKKLLSDKKIVGQYLRGEITKQELDSQGIKLGKPI